MEYAVLAAVEDEAGLDQRRMAKRLGIDTASASQMIDKLEKAKLVGRRVNPSDRRARILRLTPAGIKFRRRLRPSLLAAQKRLLRPLSVDEQGLLLDLLTRVIEGNASYARPGNNYRKRPPKTDEGIPRSCHSYCCPGHASCAASGVSPKLRPGRKRH
jgi:DNA-binding MarR family transcriptional regulator